MDYKSLRISLSSSTTTTKVTKQLPQIYYIILFFFHEWAKEYEDIAVL